MSNLSKIQEQITKAPNLKQMFQLPFIQERFIANYQAVTGKKDGQARFESELFALMEILSEKPDLAKADRFSLFAGLVKAGTTGLSFRDNKLYILPGKNNTVKIQPSPSGRREMMENMPKVKSFPEAQIVVRGDVFVVDKLNGVVKQHDSTDKSVDIKSLDDIVASYQRVKWADGTINDVVVLHNDLVKARAKSPAQSDQSFWGIYPGEASKKVATNRAFRLYHKYPDSVVMFSKDAEKEEDDMTEDVVYESQEVSAEETPTPEEPTIMQQAVSEEQSKQAPVEEAKVVTGGDRKKDMKDFLNKNK